MLLHVRTKLTITLLLFTILVSHFSEISCGRFSCSRNLSYKVKCNRCWCVKSGSFICTKMICNNIPKRFWHNIRLPTKRSRSFTLVAIAVVAALKIVKSVETLQPVLKRAFTSNKLKTRKQNMLRLQNRKLYFILLTLFVLNLIQISHAHIRWCNKRHEYKYECNRCWCLPNETFLCSKMICNMIPKEFWTKIKVVISQRGFALALFATLTVLKIVKTIEASAPLIAAVR
ncbi:hypothetical protein ILUMI_11573 [Ignelater luminosus]|uniref:Pacifastin domain-containing protein n=1 Tax=Ignelater luminosus TaxID=2038154 RepID=A0A8K0D1W8_IGNLU|nr:hypothetical protein ILUMI_11573 [Ignelater luminosus]